MSELLQGQNIVVFDCEIKEEIDGGKIGWTDYDLMGISVAALFDYQSMDFKIYMDDNLPKLVERLNSAELVVGFNIEGFDIPLVRGTEACGKGLKKALPIYDQLYWSRRSTGWKDNDRFPRGLKLDDHLEGTFGKASMKLDHGSQAPLMWRQGRMGELITYAIGDVKREAMLFEHVWNGLPVKTATHGIRQHQCPKEILKSFRANRGIMSKPHQGVGNDAAKTVGTV